MKNSERQRQNGTDPRPARMFVGRDAEGADHFFLTREDTVEIVQDGDVERRQDLNGRSIDDWMVYVEDRRGWADRRLFEDATQAMIEQLATAVEAGA